jgi:ABC-type polysaccharide/polyol phosphate export permease
VATEPLGRNSDRLRTLGLRFLGLAVGLGVIGAILILLGAGVLDVLGTVVAVVASVALVVGVGLLLSSLVGGRMAKGKPFA